MPREDPQYLDITGDVSAFWRGFHRSWHDWLRRHVYSPLGGGVYGTAAVVVVSVGLHVTGWSAEWLRWGAVTGMALGVDRWVSV